MKEINSLGLRFDVCQFADIETSTTSTMSAKTQFNPNRVEEEVWEAVQEGRYEEALVLIDELVEWTTEYFIEGAREHQLWEITTKYRENARLWIELVYGVPKAIALCKLNRTQELIEWTNRLMRCGEFNGSLEKTLHSVRAIAYLLEGKTDLAVADLKEFSSGALDNALLCWVVERELGLEILEPVAISEGELQKLSRDERVDYFLRNKQPEKALEVIAEEKNLSVRLNEKKAIALAMSGRPEEARQCLDAMMSLNPFPSQFIHYVNGDADSMRSRFLDEGEGWLLPLIYYLKDPM